MTPGPINLIHLALTVLTLTGIASILIAAHLYKRGHDGLCLRTWLVIDFAITYVVSGLIHLTGTLSTSRGFYEAIPNNPYSNDTGLLQAALTTPLALSALTIGLLIRWRRNNTPTNSATYSMATSHPILTLTAGLTLTTAAAIGSIRIRGHLANSAGERVIGVDGGMARYAFLASWMPWGVLLLALWSITRRKNPAADMRNALIMAACTGIIAVNSSWTGGRVDIVVFSLPLLILVLPWIRGLRTPLLIAGAGGALAVIYNQTISRAGVTSFDVPALLDWQWGRFSMVAWAARFATEHNYLNGETLMSGFLTVPAALLHFAGVPTQTWRSIVQYSGWWFSGSEELIFTVPGMTAELFINHGYIGVAIGYLILGLVTSLIADTYRHCRTELGRALLIYIAAILLFQTVTAQSGATTPLIIMTGAPLIGLATLETFCRWYDTTHTRLVTDTYIPASALPQRAPNQPDGNHGPTHTHPNHDRHTPDHGTHRRDHDLVRPPRTTQPHPDTPQ
ncbi:O-antigen polymerase [Dermatophilus congolensis]|uniref:O-antigen polymerase n=4 Tax=Dermatophilus congolensis TaxID=1863 RepID=UPI00312CAD65